MRNNEMRHDHVGTASEAAAAPFPISENWYFPKAKPIRKRAKTLVMGIVNLDPLSFSGVNTVPDPDAAVRRALDLVEEGADLIDIGAASSRPGAAAIGAKEEIARLGEVVMHLRERTAVPLSVDTRHSETAALVLDQGADIINDITALRGGWDPDDRRHPAMAEIVAAAGAHVILMHMPAAPAAMQQSPKYGSVVQEVREFLLRQAGLAERAGIPKDRIWLDPGFGFGKTFKHNRELLLKLSTLANSDYQVAVGLSRKQMIADIMPCPPDERLEGSLALAVIASLTGADLVRVHDVRATVKALAVADAMREGN